MYRKPRFLIHDVSSLYPEVYLPLPYGDLNDVTLVDFSAEEVSTQGPFRRYVLRWNVEGPQGHVWWIWVQGVRVPKVSSQIIEPQEDTTYLLMAGNPQEQRIIGRLTIDVDYEGCVVDRTPFINERLRIFCEQQVPPRLNLFYSQPPDQAIGVVIGEQSATLSMRLRSANVINLPQPQVDIQAVLGFTIVDSSPNMVGGKELAVFHQDLQINVYYTPSQWMMVGSDPIEVMRATEALRDLRASLYGLFETISAQISEVWWIKGEKPLGKEYRSFRIWPGTDGLGMTEQMFCPIFPKGDRFPIPGPDSVSTRTRSKKASKKK